MTITRLFLLSSITVFIINLYMIIDSESYIRENLGEIRYLWLTLVYICGMYFISAKIARYGKRFIGRRLW